MSELGVIDKTKDMQTETGNRLFSYINLVERMNVQKTKKHSVKAKHKN